jgi:hypothetical protein
MAAKVLYILTYFGINEIFAVNFHWEQLFSPIKQNKDHNEYYTLPDKIDSTSDVTEALCCYMAWFSYKKKENITPEMTWCCNYNTITLHG